MNKNDITSSRAYIFDYGGTLDTGGCHWGKVLWHAWQQAGVPADELLFREAYVYAERSLARNVEIQPDFTFRQTLDAKLRLELDYVGCLEYRERVLDIVYQQTLRHTAHSVAVLRQLAARAPLALVTNFYGNIHAVLDEMGFSGLFRHVVESAVVGVRKPDPRIFSLGVEALCVPAADVVVVGDSIGKDILPARSIGCKTIWLRGEQWTAEPVDETIPDAVIADLQELV